MPQKHVNRILLALLKALVHPVLIISIAGPSIVYLNLVFTKHWVDIFAELSTNYTDYKGLSEVLNDLWGHAVVDHSLQLYTLTLAYVFLLLEVIRTAFQFFLQRSLNLKIDRLKESILSLILGILLLSTIFGGLLVMILGEFASPEILHLYLRENQQALWEYRPPPLKSPITLARGWIALLGFVLSLWRQQYFK